MLDLNVKVSDTQQTEAALRKFAKDMAKQAEAFVTVGIHEDAGAHDGGDLTNAKLGAILHFGGTIKHPGGTNYGYATEKDAADRKVSFLKKDQGYAVLGVTGPHDIEIPPRPWLDVGVAQNNAEYLAVMRDGIKDGDDMVLIMERVGALAAASAQEYMTNLSSPPNAASTIKKKGSSNPLIDTGNLRSSVTYKVHRTGQVKEGIE